MAIQIVRTILTGWSQSKLLGNRTWEYHTCTTNRYPKILLIAVNRAFQRTVSLLKITSCFSHPFMQIMNLSKCCKMYQVSNIMQIFLNCKWWGLNPINIRKIIIDPKIWNLLMRIRFPKTSNVNRRKNLRKFKRVFKRNIICQKTIFQCSLNQRMISKRSILYSLMLVNKYLSSQLSKKSISANLNISNKKAMLKKTLRSKCAKAHRLCL